MKVKLAAGLLATLVFTGCSSQPQGQPAPTVTATATATVTSPSANAGVLQADSLTDLRDVLTGQGLACDDWSVTVKGFSGTCSDMAILTWADPDGSKDDLYQETLAFEWKVLQDRKRDDIAILLGTNCSVRLSLDDARTMQERVGGVILHG